jgi:hypothetical protein
MALIAFVVAWLNHWSGVAFLNNDHETERQIVKVLDAIYRLAPELVLLFAIIAFFESVDLLVWLKLPLYAPKADSPPDPLEAFKPPKE